MTWNLNIAKGSIAGFRERSNAALEAEIERATPDERHQQMLGVEAAAKLLEGVQESGKAPHDVFVAVSISGHAETGHGGQDHIAVSVQQIPEPA